MNFCVVPEKFSPFNKVAKITSVDQVVDLGMRIYTESKPIQWMMFLTLFSLFNIIPVNSNLPLVFRRSAEQIQLALKGTASVLSLVQSLYEFSRPIYILKDARSKKELGIAYTGFTKTRRIFKLVAYSKDDQQSCVAHFDNHGIMICKWKKEIYHFTPLPTVTGTTIKSAGYIITISDSNLDVLNFESKGLIHLKPLNILHSRIFCIEQDSNFKSEKLPSKLLMLILYFWEHNGSISLFQVGMNVTFLTKFVSDYKLIKSRNLLINLENEDDWDTLWRLILDPNEKKKLQIIEEYKIIHPQLSIPSLFQSNLKIMILQELLIKTFSDLNNLFHSTVLELEKQSHLALVIPILQSEFKQLTTRELEKNTISKNAVHWIDRVFKIGSCLGVDNVKKLKKNPKALWQFLVTVSKCSSFSERKEPSSINWISMVLKNKDETLRQYQTLTNNAFPMDTKIIDAGIRFGISDFSDESINNVYTLRLKYFITEYKESHLENFRQLDIDYKLLTNRIPSLDLKKPILDIMTNDFETFYQSQTKKGFFFKQPAKRIQDYYRILIGRFEDETINLVILNLLQLGHTPSHEEILKAIELKRQQPENNEQLLEFAFNNLYPYRTYSYPLFERIRFEEID